MALPRCAGHKKSDLELRHTGFMHGIMGVSCATWSMSFCRGEKAISAISMSMANARRAYLPEARRKLYEAMSTRF